jgi:hypothetical protein
LKHGISIVAVAAVMLAMAAPALALDVNDLWTINGAQAPNTTIYIGADSAATIDVQNGGSLSNTSQTYIGDEHDGTITVQVGGSINLANEVFLAANKEDFDLTSSINMYGTATFTGELKLGQYAGDIATVEIGNGTDAATMYVNYIQAGSSGGVATININTNGTLTADDGHIYGPGTSVHLLGGTFRVKNKPATTTPDVPETDRIFGLTSNDTIANGGVNVEVIGDYTVFTAIPEPATMSLLAIGGLALIRRRRRS